jgi:chorismate synthase
MLKYDTDDARDILERASARETAARTIAGVLARKLLATTDIDIVSHVVAIGGVIYEGPMPGPHQTAEVDASEVRCLDRQISARTLSAESSR